MPLFDGETGDAYLKLHLELNEIKQSFSISTFINRPAIVLMRAG